MNGAAKFFAIVTMIAAYKKKYGSNANYQKRKNTYHYDSTMHLVSNCKLPERPEIL